MDKKNNNNLEQNTAEDREFVRLNKTYEKVSDGSSKFFYACIALLNILSVAICYLVLNQKFLVEKPSIIFESLDYKIWILLLLSFLLILFLKTLPMFLKIYNKTKNKNFVTSFSNTIIGEYYGRVTLCSCGQIPMCTRYLNSKGHETKNSIDVNFGTRFFDKLSFVIYAIPIFIFGIIFSLDKINIWFVVLGIVLLLIYIAQILIVFMFKKNKKKTIEFLSKFVKFLYNSHIIKNYEKLYYKWIDRLIIYTKEFKQNKWLIFTEMVANIFRYFLKAIVIYFVIITLNISDSSMLGDLLVATIILDLALQFWPLKYGTFIYEIVFIILFKNLFFDGYVFWGLLLYRIFDYYLYVLYYLLWDLCVIIKRKSGFKVNK